MRNIVIRSVMGYVRFEYAGKKTHTHGYSRYRTSRYPYRLVSRWKSNKHNKTWISLWCRHDTDKNSGSNRITGMCAVFKNYLLFCRLYVHTPPPPDHRTDVKFAIGPCVLSRCAGVQTIRSQSFLLLNFNYAIIKWHFFSTHNGYDEG